MEYNLVEEVLDTFSIKELSEFRQAFLSHPYDCAQAFLEMTDDQRFRLYHSLAPAELSPIIAEIDDSIFVVDYFDEMYSNYAAKVLEHMPIDDAVAILSRIKRKNQLASYLSQMDIEHAKQIQQLLAYEENSW